MGAGRLQVRALRQNGGCQVEAFRSGRRGRPQCTAARCAGWTAGPPAHRALPSSGKPIPLHTNRGNPQACFACLLTLWVHSGRACLTAIAGRAEPRRLAAETAGGWRQRPWPASNHRFPLLPLPLRHAVHVRLHRRQRSFPPLKRACQPGGRIAAKKAQAAQLPLAILPTK